MGTDKQKKLRKRRQHPPSMEAVVTGNYCEVIVGIMDKNSFKKNLEKDNKSSCFFFMRSLSITKEGAEVAHLVL